MPRLPLLDPDDAPEEVRGVLAQTPLSLLRMIGHAQSALRPWLRYSATLLTRLELEPLLRELAILQVAHLSDSRYEWVQHVPLALAVGGSEEQIEAIENGEELHASLSEVQREVLGFTRAVIADGSADEHAVARLDELLGTRQVVELLLVIGHYRAIAGLIATTGLEPDPPLAPGSLAAQGPPPPSAG